MVTSISPPAHGLAASVLHIGCGIQRLTTSRPPFSQSGWRDVRVDINPSAAPDVVGSITGMRTVPDGSFDVVYSSHNLAHLDAH